MPNPTENLYDDGPAAAPEPAPAPTAETEEPVTEESGTYESAPLPKSLFPGQDLKAGDMVTLKVDKVTQNEILVCPPDKAETEEAEAEPAAPAAGGDAEMRSMMEA